MMVIEPPVSLQLYDAVSAQPHIPVVEAIYAAAFGEPPYLEGPDDVAEWRDDLSQQLTRPGFALVVATVDEQPGGFAYGYTMTRDMPRWERIVEPFTDAVPTGALMAGRIFTIMEFAVSGERRRHGIGRALHDRLLAGRDEPLALLTVRADAEAAQAAYKAWGWRKVGHRPRDNEPGYDVLVKELTVPQLE